MHSAAIAKSPREVQRERTGIAHWNAVCERTVRHGEQNFKNESCGKCHSPLTIFCPNHNPTNGLAAKSSDPDTSIVQRNY